MSCNYRNLIWMSRVVTRPSDVGRAAVVNCALSLCVLMTCNGRCLFLALDKYIWLMVIEIINVIISRGIMKQSVLTKTNDTDKPLI